ncbi:MAG: tetratricopeptide repeat protein, partial [bacterium]
SESVLKRLYVVSLDADRDSDAGSQIALDGLRQILVDESQADAAWATLVRHALKLGQRGKWTRAEVEALLKVNNFKLRPVGPDSAWLEQIDFARKLNSRWRPRTAAGLLDHLIAEIGGRATEGDTLRQLHGVRGASALMVDDPDRARAEFSRALDFIPLRVDATTAESVRKTWCDVRTNYGLVLHIAGQDGDAASIARDVIEVNGRHVNAWALLLQATGTEDATVPVEVASAREYRDALARVAAHKGDWRRVVEELEPIAQASEASPPTLSTYGQGLLNLSREVVDGPGRRHVIERAERAGDAAIRVLENGEVESLLAMVLFVRARARELLGRPSEAAPDYNRAAALNPEDPNILMHVVGLRVENDDRIGAMNLLTDAAAEASPAVRVLRADLRASGGDTDRAIADLSIALDALPRIASRGMVALYLRLAELALNAERDDLAERALSAISAAGLGDDGPDAGVLRGRVAGARKDWEAAVAEFKAAASHVSGDERSLILAELGAVLGAGGQLDRAIQVFEEAGAVVPSHPAFKNYVVALMKGKKFDRIASLATSVERTAIDAGGTSADLPPRLLDAAIDVATRTEDHATAARLLDARIEQERRRGVVPLQLVLHAAMAHADNSNNGRAAELVNDVLSRDSVAPEDRMRAANVLVKVGAHRRAREVAFAAVRAQPNDRRMIANFISVVLLPSLRPAGAPSTENEEGDEQEWQSSGETIASRIPGDDDDDPDVGAEGRSGEVRPDVFVRVLAQDGQRHEYFIYSDPPVDAR